tara:strand:+ start:151 stop:453 length:303 start_codon:yes stop_codon:yes gene_type:complete
MTRLQINLEDTTYKSIKIYASRTRKPISKIITEIVGFHKKGFEGFKESMDSNRQKEKMLLERISELKLETEILSKLITDSMNIEIEDIDVVMEQVKKTKK